MALKNNTNNKGGKAKFEKVVPAADTYPALISQIIDLGSQFNTDYQSGEIQTWDDGNPKINNEVYITFELPTQTHTFNEDIGPQPLWVSKRYNIFGKPIKELLTACGLKEEGNVNLADLAGKLCYATTGLTAGGNAKIVSVSKAKAKYLNPETEEVEDTANYTLSKGECVLFDVDDQDQEVYDAQPQFIKDMIDTQATVELYEGMNKPQEEGNY